MVFTFILLIFQQGSVVRKDFNVAEEAGGIGKGITLEQDVIVNGSTLEIHLYWAGKGTTAVPNRGVYGPLISAISVTPSEYMLNSRLPTYVFDTLS